MPLDDGRLFNQFNFITEFSPFSELSESEGTGVSRLHGCGAEDLCPTSHTEAVGLALQGIQSTVFSISLNF